MLILDSGSSQGTDVNKWDYRWKTSISNIPKMILNTKMSMFASGPFGLVAWIQGQCGCGESE